MKPVLRHFRNGSGFPVCIQPRILGIPYLTRRHRVRFGNESRSSYHSKPNHCGRHGAACGQAACPRVQA